MPEPALGGAPGSAPGTTSPVIPRIARVLGRRRESADVCTLEIRDPEPATAPFEPGQFNMLTVFGVGEIAVSLSGDPKRCGRHCHTVRALGPVSKALAAMRRGNEIGVRGPFGRGWPLSAAVERDVVVLAGGLGIAPLRPLLYRLRAERARYGRVVLLYGTRSPDDVLFGRDLQGWLPRAGIEVQLTVDHSTAGWPGHVGVVTTLVPRVGLDPKRTVAFVCGPEVMMRLTVAALRAAGVEDEAIYLSMERNMKCAVAWCGRCQFDGTLVCRDGPVFRSDRVCHLLAHKEL